jgi:hypothetical protein
VPNRLNRLFIFSLTFLKNVQASEEASSPSPFVELFSWKFLVFSFLADFPDQNGSGFETMAHSLDEFLSYAFWMSFILRILDEFLSYAFWTSFILRILDEFYPTHSG